jgi:ABC-type nitrate/sulfonate/bicarbonate transport system substrate-binding protein
MNEFCRFMLPTNGAAGEGVGVVAARRIRGGVLLVTVAVLALAAGCSGSGSAARASQPEKPVLTVAVVPAVDSAGFFVALDQGLFKAQGLTVNFPPPPAARPRSPTR